MIGRLRSKFTREFTAFIFARLAGVGIKPLILLVAGITSRERFAEDYALLVSALASLFVLAGAQTHIRFYKRRFSEVRPGYAKAFQTYLDETLTQFFLAVALIAVAALLWTRDPVILVSILLLVGVEKFFDEEMRYFQFTKEYYLWSRAFAFRTLVPGLATLGMLPIFDFRLIWIYTITALLAFAIYGAIRRRHFLFYGSILGRLGHRMASRPGTELAQFGRRWRDELAQNQMWTFASINVLLIDRLVVADAYPSRIDEYVFFSQLFNITNVAHSMLYFVPRRPELIRDLGTSSWRELARLANLLPPALYAVAAFAIAMIVRNNLAPYANVSLTLILGLALSYLIYSINLVGVEYVFWRVERKYLLLCDLAVIATVAGVALGLAVPFHLISLVAAGGLFIRLVAYQIMAARSAARNGPDR